jgi:hypothetical protein
VLPKGPIVRACWCTIRVEPWVYPCANSSPRMTKRKREGTDTSHGKAERVIKWKAGPDPKDNAIQAASTLNAFAGENVMLVYEVAEALIYNKINNS